MKSGQGISLGPHEAVELELKLKKGSQIHLTLLLKQPTNRM